MHEENEEKIPRGSADPRQLLKEILSVAAVALQDFRQAIANEVEVEDAARKAVELIRRPGAILTKL